MTKQIEYHCPVISVAALDAPRADGSHTQKMITFHCPPIAETARPGQFVALSCAQFLRRPLGIARVDRVEGTVSVGGRAKGEGMADLLELRPDDTVSVLGPLGHGFELENLDSCIVAGGGTGVYPMLFLLDELRARGVKTGAAFGFRDKANSVLVDEFQAVSDVCVVASEAGDMDVEGDILAAITLVARRLDFVADENGARLGDGISRGGAVLTCGPTPMMRAVAEFAKTNGLSCQVSLEERMACGVGLCLVCACKTKDPSQSTGWRYTRCCKEGPVYDAEEVVWQ
ncbi:MAG: dihydroorotate dehydrogenase electron transfer subunit [Fastidiosipilaceae bacterium]|jgi:dihydroorotate dehydrogenase electron transfer subunit